MKTRGVTVTDSDGREHRATVKRLTQGDYFQFMEIIAASGNAAETYRGRVEFILKHGVADWAITDEDGALVPRDAIDALDVGLVESLVDEVKAYNPAIFPEGRRVTGEAALGWLVSEGVIDKDKAVEVLSALRHDRPTRPEGA